MAQLISSVCMLLFFTVYLEREKLKVPPKVRDLSSMDKCRYRFDALKWKNKEVNEWCRSIASFTGGKYVK